MFRFVVDHIIEGAPLCYVASKVTEAMVIEITVHAAVNVVELFGKIIVVMQTTLFLDSPDVAVRFIKAMRIRYPSSRLVVIEGC